MTHVKNNAIALGIQILLCGCFFCYILWGDASYFSDDTHTIFLILAIVIVCVLLYLAGGFFLLRPVERFSLLSVCSVAIVLIVIYIFLFIKSGMGGIFFVNPITYYGYLTTFIDFPGNVNEYITKVIIVTSPLLPSLFIYLGMLLKKRFRKAKTK